MRLERVRNRPARSYSRFLLALSQPVKCGPRLTRAPLTPLLALTHFVPFFFVPFGHFFFLLYWFAAGVWLATGRVWVAATRVAALTIPFAAEPAEPRAPTGASAARSATVRAPASATRSPGRAPRRCARTRSARVTTNSERGSGLAHRNSSSISDDSYRLQNRFTETPLVVALLVPIPAERARSLHLQATAPPASSSVLGRVGAAAARAPCVRPPRSCSSVRRGARRSDARKDRRRNGAPRARGPAGSAPGGPATTRAG